MDLSNEYITMCEAAEEIQQLRHFTDTTTENDVFAKEGGVVFGKISLGQAASKRIWLPRQDQLQDIWINHSPHLNYFGILFSHMTGYIKENEQYLESLCEGDQRYAHSGEQFWLLLLMNFRYKKQWNRVTKVWEAIS